MADIMLIQISWIQASRQANWHLAWIQPVSFSEYHLSSTLSRF